MTNFVFIAIIAMGALLIGTIIVGIIESFKSKVMPNPGQPKLVVPQSRSPKGDNRRPNGYQRIGHAKGTAGDEDRVGVLSFASDVHWILAPTRVSDPGVSERIAKIASPRYFRGGGTNLSVGLETALQTMEKWTGTWLRKIVLVTDGEATIDEMFADRARRARVSLCVIHVGNGNNPQLRKLVQRTVGGWFESAGDFSTLARAMRRGGSVDHSGNGRRGFVLILADTSSSMQMSFPGAPGQGRRIDALVGAVADWRGYHAATYRQPVSVRA